MLKRGEELDELGQHDIVKKGDVDRVGREAGLVGVVLGELGGVIGEATLEEERAPAGELDLLNSSLAEGSRNS